MNLRFKVSLLLLSVLLLSSAILIGVGYRHYHSTLKKQIVTQQNNLCQSVVENVDRFLYERLVDTRNIALYSEINNDRPNPQEIQKQLATYNRLNSNYQSISYFDNQRIRLADTRYKSVGEQHTLSKYWVKLQNRDYALDVSKSESLNEIVIHFATNILDEANKKLGTVVTRLKIGELYKVISSVFDLRDFSTLAQVELIDQNGVLLYSSFHPEEVLETVPEYYAQIQESEKGSVIEYKDYLLFTKEEKGYSDFQGNHWRLVMLVDKAKVFAPLDEMNRQFLMAFGVMFVFCLLMSLLLSKHFTDPVMELVDLAKDYSLGKFNTKVKVRHRDEIGMLSTSMQDMACKLDRRIKDYLDLNNELNKKYLLISDQKEEITSKNEQMNSSLRYAKKIQQTLLENNQLVEDEILSMDVLYKPLNEVSGDFYFTKTVIVEDRPVYIVVVGDCTGHGVPGAFLTIIALNFLDEIIASGVYVPSQIISALHKKVSNVLTNNSQFILDSIDLGVLSFDSKDDFVTYSGANRPLLIKEEFEVRRVKGSKFSVGATLFNQVSETCDVQIPLEEVHSFYLFSDGITDQFGRTNKRKLGTKQLQAFINEQQDFVNQDGIGGYFSEWKGSTEQTDDIVFVSVAFDYNAAKKYSSRDKGRLMLP